MSRPVVLMGETGAGIRTPFHQSHSIVEASMLAHRHMLATGLIATLLMAAPVRASDLETLAPSEVKVGMAYYVETKPIPARYGLERSTTYEGVVLQASTDELVIEGNQGAAQSCTKPWLTRIPFVSGFYKSFGYRERKPAEQFRVAVDEIESIRVVQPRKTAQKTVFAGNR